MVRISKMLWFTILIMFFSGNLVAQDEELLFLDDEEKSSEDVVCIPEDLSTAYDHYAGLEDAASKVPQWYSFGSEYFKNKNYEAALPYLWKVFMNNKAKRGGLSIGKIAEAYFKQKKIDSTLIACYKGFEVYPDNQKLHYYAGFLQKELGKNSCAIPHYQELVDNNPENVSYLATIAFLFAKVEDYAKAIEYQQKVVNLKPEDSSAREALANYLQSSGASPKDAYKETFKKDPTNFDAGRSWAKYAIEEGLYEEALEPLNMIISKGPEKDDYRSRALTYENLGKFNNAITDLNSWMTLEKDNPDILLSIALNYSLLKKFSTANNWIAKALRIKPGYGKAYIARGELYEAMVQTCQENRDGKVKLEDKIVYEEAVKQYVRAQQDLAFKSKAATRARNLKPFVRTGEEKFMEPNAKIKSDCYSFLKQ